MWAWWVGYNALGATVGGVLILPLLWALRDVTAAVNGWAVSDIAANVLLWTSVALAQVLFFRQQRLNVHAVRWVVLTALTEGASFTGIVYLVVPNPQLPDPAQVDAIRFLFGGGSAALLGGLVGLQQSWPPRGLLAPESWYRATRWWTGANALGLGAGFLLFQIATVALTHNLDLLSHLIWTLILVPASVITLTGAAAITGLALIWPLPMTVPQALVVITDEIAREQQRRPSVGATLARVLVGREPPRPQTWVPRIPRAAWPLLAVVLALPVAWWYSQVLRPYLGASPILARPGQGVHQIAFAPDGATLAVGLDYDSFTPGAQNVLQLWRVADGTLLHSLLPAKVRIDTLHFSPDGQTLAVGFGDPSDLPRVQIWRVADGTPVHVMPDAATAGAAFAPDGTTFLYSAFDGVRILDTARWKTQHTLPGPANALALTANGQTLAVSSYAGVQLWHVADWTRRQWLAGSLLSMAFAPDGQTLAAYDLKTKVIRVWRVADGTVRGQWPVATDQQIFDLGFTPDGTTLLGRTGSNQLRMWHTADGSPRDLAAIARNPLESPLPASVGAFALTADGLHLGLAGQRIVELLPAGLFH